MDINKLLVDINAIESGKWIALGADFPGVEVKVTGLSAKPAEVMRAKLERQAPREERLRNGSLTDEAQDRIIRKVIIEKCLHDWRGFTRDGKPLEYDREMAELFLFKKEGRVIGKAIVDAIVSLEDTRIEREDDIVGN